MVENLVMYGRPVIRKQQLEKEDFKLQEARSHKLPAHLRKLRLLLTLTSVTNLIMILLS